MSDLFIVAIGVVVVLFTTALIWTLSASTIATECELLGAFYVGGKVYKCEVKK